MNTSKSPRASIEEKSKKTNTKNLNSARSKYFSSKTSSFKFPQKKFEEETLNRAINLLIYGVNLIKYCKKGKIYHKCHFYILEDDPSYLQWISIKKPYSKTRINLANICNLCDDPTWKTSIIFTKSSSNLLFLSYSENSEKEKDLLLKFKNEETKLLWWQGLQYFARRAVNLPISNDQKKQITKTLFLKADKDGSKTLEFNETKNLLQQLHIEINKEFLTKLYEKYDKDKNKAIDYHEFEKLIEDIMQKPEVFKIFCNYCEKSKYPPFESNCEMMTERELLKFLKEEQKENITKDEVRKLIRQLREIQIVKSSISEVNMLSKSDTMEDLKISLNEFTSILFSIGNRIFNPEKEIIYQSMDESMSDYYINTSHNTYLLANQLTGESSTKAYIHAFAKGCRCVELDCWDGEKGEPLIYHGFTLTTKILFEDVINTINDYGFSSNPYPIILSIENHCKGKQQERMAEILENILGDKLYKLPQNFSEYECYPSPNMLKYKVIIKDKGTLPTTANFWSCMEVSTSDKKIDIGVTDLVYHDFDEENIYMEKLNKNLWDYHSQMVKDTFFLKYNNIFKSEINQKYEQYAKEKANSLLIFKNQQIFSNSINNTTERINIISTQKLEEINNPKYPISPKNSSPKHNKISIANAPSLCPELPLVSQSSVSNLTNSEIGGYLDKDKKEKNHHEKNPKFQKILALFGIKMSLFNLQNRSPWNITSINERKIEKYLKENEKEIIDFHRKFFTRVYPSGKRVDSSNYDPMDSFNAGSQFIALNMQTNDLSLLLYLSKFVENGGNECGYVLKPAFLRPNPKKEKYISDFKNIRKIVNILVISGQQLRPEDENDVKDVVDPYVEVSLRGILLDEEENKKIFKSQTVKNNGFNPMFELKTQFKLYCPENAIIIFKVFDQEGGLQKDTRLGWYAIPFSCMRQGYRIVPLLNSQLKHIEFSYLFVKIEIKDVI